MNPQDLTAHIEAPDTWQQIDFVSDLHLSTETPLTTEHFLGYLRQTTADAIFILGDCFEVWVGDDVLDDPTCFESRLIHKIAGTGTPKWLGFMAGNRDFLLGPRTAKKAHFHRMQDPCLLEAFGQRLLLTHGDALCLEDTSYQAFRRQIRNPQWQQDFLSQPLGVRQQTAAQMRAASSNIQKNGSNHDSLWADVDQAAATDWLAQSQAQLMIHGHTHRPGTHAMDEHHVRWVLSDWDHDHRAHHRSEVLRLDTTGLHRLSL
jgi:UDP-2,3-diacylglucosamine hydrolase